MAHCNFYLSAPDISTLTHSLTHNRMESAWLDMNQIPIWCFVGSALVKSHGWQFTCVCGGFARWIGCRLKQPAFTLVSRKARFWGRMWNTSWQKPTKTWPQRDDLDWRMMPLRMKLSRNYSVRWSTLKLSKAWIYIVWHRLRTSDAVHVFSSNSVSVIPSIFDL